MRDYLEYLRNSGLYNSKVLETELEFDSSTKDAIEVSIKTVWKEGRKGGLTYTEIRHYKILSIIV